MWILRGRFKRTGRQVTVERRRNKRGAFIKIIENVNGRRDCVCLPVEGLPELIGVLEQLRTS
jgi:hypothetical protein